jgi:hypothetical protein
MVIFDRQKVADTGKAPDGYKLIEDIISLKVLKKENVIVEGVNGREENVLRIESLLQRGNAINENTRYYDMKTVLTPAVQGIERDIKSRSVMGEFDHPKSLQINLDRVSHLMTDIWIDGQEVYGTAEILHRTPHGAALRGILEHDVKVGISSRGAGQLTEDRIDDVDIILVEEGFRFITWDVVAKPSVSDAILQISESLEYKTKDLKRESKRIIQTLGKEAYDRMLVNQINSFFNLK